jgi:deoxyribonuclease IV
VPLLGAHCSIAGGFYKAVEEAHRVGCEIVQIFTGAPQQWPSSAPKSGGRSGKLVTKSSRSRALPLHEGDVTRFKAALADLKITHPIAHASYLINLASPAQELRQKSIAGMVVELQRADQLGIPYVVLHPGAHTTTSAEEGIALVAASIDEIHRLTPGIQTQIALELTAGQGTCLGSRLEQIAAIIGQVQRSHEVRVCLDTCHVFAAGYDIGNRRDYLGLWRQFDELLGLPRLVAIHLNDSKRELGSRVDRHEHIGHGKIGLEAFRLLLRDKRFREVPMYLETPKGDHDGEPWDVTNLRTLRELAKK